MIDVGKSIRLASRHSRGLQAESIQHALDARLKIAGMTHWNGRFMGVGVRSSAAD
jgi:hypothetical protein